MLRLGLHYVEPRRVGFFLAEEGVAWATGALAALVVARVVGAPTTAGGLVVLAVGVAGFVALGMSLGDLHDLKVALDGPTSGRRTLKLVGAMCLAGAALALAGPWRGAAATVVVGGVAGAGVALLGLRAALPAIEQRIGLRTRVFLVGEGQAAHRLVREIVRDGAVEVVGFCGPRAVAMAEKARAAGAQLVVVALDDRRGFPTSELMRCRLLGLEVCEGAHFAARALHRLPVELVKPSDLIFGDGFVSPAWVRLCRRVISVTVALVLLVATSPLVALAVLAIRRDSPGPVLFRQTRVGLRGRPFEILKLRTMSVGAEEGGATWAQSGDPRVTRVGRLLRRYRVDELPQLVNVLRGEMELIGPRPERPEFVAMLREQIPYYDLRHLVPPGITGWAQVSYPYAASVEEACEKLQYDLYHVRHLSLSLDVLILLLTARTVLLGRGAR